MLGLTDSEEESDTDQTRSTRQTDEFTPAGRLYQGTGRQLHPAACRSLPVRSRHGEHSRSLWEIRNNGRDTETPGPRAVLQSHRFKSITTRAPTTTATTARQAGLGARTLVMTLMTRISSQSDDSDDSSLDRCSEFG